MSMFLTTGTLCGTRLISFWVGHGKALRHNIPRPNFLKGNRDTLALFIDFDEAMAIEKAVK